MVSNIDGVRSSALYIQGQLEVYWASTGQDKESVLLGLLLLDRTVFLYMFTEMKYGNMEI